MDRIFLIVGTFAIVCLLATLVMGLSLGDVPAALDELRTLEPQLNRLESGAEPAEPRHLAELRDQVDALLRVERWKTVHFLSGITSALAVLLAAGIVVTYFIGTSRWCREVVETYRLDTDFIHRSTRLKRSTFPFALVSMLTMLVVVASGGAADPAASLKLQPIGGVTWAQCHLMAALLGTALIAYAFYRLWTNLLTSAKIIAEIVDQVRRIRQEKGLPV